MSKRTRLIAALPVAAALAAGTLAIVGVQSADAGQDPAKPKRTSAVVAADAPDLGPNVDVFDPSMS